MSKPVLDLKEYISWLKMNREQIASEFAKVMSPKELKQTVTEAVVGNPGERVTAFKEVLDNIRQEGYYQGQLAIVDHLILVAEKQLKNFEEKANVPPASN